MINALGKFLSRKTIELTAITNRLDLVNYAPVSKSSEYIPKWWKQLPSTLEVDNLYDAGSMKYCSGVLDIFSKGFVIPMWSDLSIEIGKIGTTGYRYQFADEKSFLDSHSDRQRGSFAKSDIWQHIKLVSPWRFYCEENIDFLLLDSFWQKSDITSFTTPPGIIKFNEVTTCNINLFYKREETNKKHFIEFRTPIAQIIPITDKKIRLKVKCVDDAQMQSISDRHGKNKFAGDDLFKRALRNKTTKCPFK